MKFNNNGRDTLKSSNVSFKYQPIFCKFGRFWGIKFEYLNKINIKRNTPKIEDINNIVYEEIDVPENVIELVKAVKWTMKRTNSGKMIYIFTYYNT